MSNLKILTASDIQALVSMPIAIEAVHRAYASIAAGTTTRKGFGNVRHLGLACEGGYLGGIKQSYITHGLLSYLLGLRTEMSYSALELSPGGRTPGFSSRNCFMLV